MAVPSSGSLSLRSIATEIETNVYQVHPTDGLGLSQLGATSLRDVSQGPIAATNSSGSLINSGINNDGFQVLNTDNPLSNRPNGNVPHAMSEFYGYDHDLVLSTTPTVVTNNASSITSNSMTLNGNMTSTGNNTVTSKGFVYSSAISNPFKGGIGVTTVTVFNPNSTGAYTGAATALSSSTTYYIKAWATNSEGTSYGSVRQATTSAPSYTTKYTDGPHNKNLFACYQTSTTVIKYSGSFTNGITVYDNNLNAITSAGWYNGPNASSGGSSDAIFYVNSSGVVSNISIGSC